jgi:deazaflavin-dependent oxidoreductase (nitroreductase family)
VAVPTNEEFIAYNKGVIEEFRTHGGIVTQPDFPILLLTTTGARSGRRSTTPLGYGVDGDRVFVVASKAGAPTHPAWFHNLSANPSVKVELGTDVFEATAVITEDAERDRLHRTLAGDASAFTSALTTYEQDSNRVFPVVVLDGVRPPR